MRQGHVPRPLQAGVELWMYRMFYKFENDQIIDNSIVRHVLMCEREGGDFRIFSSIDMHL